MQYVKGDKVEVLNTTLEHSWHPARILDGNGDVYTVWYGHYNVEVVLAKNIRPCPPFVEFTNWSRGDLVHVFDSFAWKLATVLKVMKDKCFMVRVVGSMLDLIVGAAKIRVRHCWQDGRWIVIGKGASVTDAIRLRVRRRTVISSLGDLQINKGFQTARKTITYKKSQKVPASLIMWTRAGTQDKIETWRKVARIQKTVERHSPFTRNQTDTCTGTGTESRLTKERLPGTYVTMKETNEKHQDRSNMSSVGSCSINSYMSSRQYPEKCVELRCEGDVSDAESSTKTSKKPRKRKKRNAAALDRLGTGLTSSGPPVKKL